MSNRQLKFGLIAFVLSSIIVFAVSLPAASALTQRDFTYLNDRHHTDRFPGGQKVCGDHLCTVQEWSDMKKALQDSQRNNSACEDLKQWRACGEGSNQPSKP